MVSAFLVLMRVGSVTALLPGFGEQSIPMRIRLLVALAFTAIVWPVVSPAFNISLQAMPLLMLTESAIGIMIGISIRMIVMALQLAGSIAAQSTTNHQGTSPRQRSECSVPVLVCGDGRATISAH